MRVAGPKEFIYFENDPAEEVFFLKANAVNYVLPGFAETPYLQVQESTSFGAIDFMAELVFKYGEQIKKTSIL
jgi:hypothetical protein